MADRTTVRVVATVVVDAGGTGFYIERLWAYVAVHDDGDEGVVAIGNLPAVAADHARVEALRPHMTGLAKALGKEIKLVRFDRRVDVEVFNP